MIYSFIPNQPNFYLVLKHAAQEGLEHIRALESQGKYISAYTNFPKLEWLESGLPHVTVSFDSPKHYSLAFDNKFEQTALTWKTYIELVNSSPAARQYYQIENDTDASPYHINHMFYSIKCLIERYIYISGQIEWDEEKFIPVYEEWERCVFSQNLDFDILVPLLYVKFDFDSFYSKTLGIERINENMQLARMHSFYSSSNDIVVGAATHALILKNWQIRNDSYYYRIATLDNQDAFSKPIEIVDQFLASLRAVTGIETGYAQLIINPQGWGDAWIANLPVISKVSLKAYPDHFENREWLKAPPLITQEQTKIVFDLYNLISSNPSNKLFLACKRLNTAYLRRTEDDAILDITIGLEALLANDSKGEITYRLAIRLASLTKLEKFESYNATEIFEFCKKIYEYRSAVIHGSHDIKKKRVIKVQEKSEPIEAIKIGLELLRYAIRVLSKNKDLLEPKNMDYFLLRQ